MEAIRSPNDFICAETAPMSQWLSKNYSIPDVIKIRKSYTRIDVQVFEIKASRADFLSDIRSDKWKEYLAYSSRFYFATPQLDLKEVVQDASEIPEEAGWIVKGNKTWRVKKTPRIRKFEPNWKMFFALLLSQDKDLHALERECEHLKTVNHTENARANLLSKKRYAKIERLLDERRVRKEQTKTALEIINKILGTKIDSWNWERELKEEVKSLRSNVPRSLIRELRSMLQNFKGLEKSAGKILKEAKK